VKLKPRRVHVPRAAGLTAAVCAAALLAQAVPAAGQEGSPDDEMAKWMEMAAPGPHHAQMMKSVGTWEIHSKMWMDPSQPAMETSGESTITSLLDGRFLSEVIHAPMMGMPWEGRGIYGFDKGTGKHTGIWFDSFGTMMMSFEGECDGQCGVITMYSDYTDPTSGQPARVKSVVTRLDDDHSKQELYNVMKDGSEVKIMESAYTRKTS
jgi:hypothetical protein